MVVGATTSGVFLVAYVLAMEMVGPKFRFSFHISCLPGKAILNPQKNSFSFNMQGCGRDPLPILLHRWLPADGSGWCSDLSTKVLEPDLDLDLAQVAYLLNWNWQLLQIVLTIPSLLFLSYWWVVPESVRWQISKVPFCVFFLWSFCNQEIPRVSTLRQRSR